MCSRLDPIHLKHWRCACGGADQHICKSNNLFRRTGGSCGKTRLCAHFCCKSFAMAERGTVDLCAAELSHGHGSLHVKSGLKTTAQYPQVLYLRACHMLNGNGIDRGRAQATDQIADHQASKIARLAIEYRDKLNVIRR